MASLNRLTGQLALGVGSMGASILDGDVLRIPGGGTCWLDEAQGLALAQFTEPGPPEANRLVYWKIDPDTNRILQGPFTLDPWGASALSGSCGHYAAFLAGTGGPVGGLRFKFNALEHPDDPFVRRPAAGPGYFDERGVLCYITDYQNGGLTFVFPDTLHTVQFANAHTQQVWMAYGRLLWKEGVTVRALEYFDGPGGAVVNDIAAPKLAVPEGYWPNPVACDANPLTGFDWFVVYGTGEKPPRTLCNPWTSAEQGWIFRTGAAFNVCAAGHPDHVVSGWGLTQGEAPGQGQVFTEPLSTPMIPLKPIVVVPPDNPTSPPTKPIVTGATIPTVVAPGRKIIRVLFKGHNLRTGDFNPCPGQWEVIDDGTNASDAIVWPRTNPDTYKPVLVTFNSTQGESLKTHMQGMFGGQNQPHDSLPSAIENCAIQWQRDHGLPAVMVRFSDGAFPPGFFDTFNVGDVAGVEAYCNPDIDESNETAWARIESWIQQVPVGFDVMLVRGFNVKYWSRALSTKERVQRMLDFQVGLAELERKYPRITYSALFCWGRWAVHPNDPTIIIDGGGYYFQESNDFAWTQWANL